MEERRGRREKWRSEGEKWRVGGWREKINERWRIRRARNMDRNERRVKWHFFCYL